MENLVPIRLDIEIEGQRLKDVFTWNLSDSDSDVLGFAKRTVKDLKLSPIFINQITQSIQSQLSDFRAVEGQDIYIRQKIVPLKLDLRVTNTVVRDQFLWDLSNVDSDPEEFARDFCSDMKIEDPEVGPAIAVAIREQLFEMAVQSITSVREHKVSKKGRKGLDYTSYSKINSNSLELVKLFGNKGTVVRKRKEWDLYEPIVDILSNEEVLALEAREERNARMKRKLDDLDENLQTRYIRV